MLLIIIENTCYPLF